MFGRQIPYILLIIQMDGYPSDYNGINDIRIKEYPSIYYNSITGLYEFMGYHIMVN